MRLSPGVDFINVLQAAFMGTDIESAKKDNQVVSLFALLRSARVKAARRTLMRLSPGVNFINVSLAAFAPVDPKSVKRY